MKYNFFSNTDVGKKRVANEDAYGDQETPNGHVFVVCDGMGGHAGGAKASNMAVSSILEFFAREPIENIIIGIDKAISFANEQIFATAQAEPELKGMGTTVTVVVLRDAEVYIGHVGDSRIYLKSNGELNRITKDHSKVQELVDRGIISDADAETHPEKNIILRALGIKPEVESTVCSVSLKLSKGDVLLMCSDGLSGLVTDNEMQGMINFDKLEGSVDALITSANNNGGPDNITATLIAITESVHSASKFQEFNPIITQDVSTGSSEPTVNLTDSNPKSERNWKTIILSGIGGVITLVFLGYLLFPSEDDIENKSPKEDINKETVSDTILEQDGDDGGGEVISEPLASPASVSKPIQTLVEEVAEQADSTEATSTTVEVQTTEQEGSENDGEEVHDGQGTQEGSKQPADAVLSPHTSTAEEDTLKLENKNKVPPVDSKQAGEKSTKESESGGGNINPPIK